MEIECVFGFRMMSKIALIISQRLSDMRLMLMNQLTL